MSLQLLVRKLIGQQIADEDRVKVLQTNLARLDRCHTMTLKGILRNIERTQEVRKEMHRLNCAIFDRGVRLQAIARADRRAAADVPR